MEEQKQSKWQKLKEKWKVPRYRALIILGGYLIFFLVLIAFIRSTPIISVTPEVPEEKEELKTFKEYDNYEFTYTFKNEVEEHKLTGERLKEVEFIHDLKNKIEYVWQNDTFYQKNETLELISDRIYEIPLLKLHPEELNKLLEKATLQYEKEYEETKQTKTYEVSLKEFYGWLDGLYSDQEAFITIVTEEENGLMIKIQMDLSAYNGTTLTLEYSNHDKLSNLKAQ